VIIKPPLPRAKKGFFGSHDLLALPHVEQIFQSVAISGQRMFPRPDNTAISTNLRSGADTIRSALCTQGGAEVDKKRHDAE
jgi:hypothetical protein